jgi:hypothetical protein
VVRSTLRSFALLSFALLRLASLNFDEVCRACHTSGELGHMGVGLG